MKPIAEVGLIFSLLGFYFGVKLSKDPLCENLGVAITFVSITGFLASLHWGF